MMLMIIIIIIITGMWCLGAIR